MRGYNEVRVTPPIKIKVLDERCRPEQHGDWCDLKMFGIDQFYQSYYPDGEIQPHYEATDDAKTNFEFHEQFEYCKGDIFKISLGVAMQIPEGYHAQLASRSSTRKNYGVILTNAIGIIDNAYCGDNDVWMAEFYAVNDGKMKMGDRILQFRLVKNGNPIQFDYVESLGNDDRGGFGSTGK